MIGRRAKLRNITEEATCVGELCCSAAHVGLFQEELDEPRVLLSGCIEVISIQERSGQASMRDEVLWIDRNGSPQERSRRDPVVSA